MTTPTPDQYDQATIDLIFALRDSLTDDGPSRIDFWNGRATSALLTAAAGSDNAGQAIMQTAASSGQLAPWTGLGVYLLWILIALTGAALLVQHRDA